LWILLPVLAVPTVIIWRNAIIRCGPGRCIKCGYDLSGLPAPTDPTIPPRCPECGHQRAQSHQPSPTAQPHSAPH
jgi:predicted Zn-ribbon and HTH transcriptional regulator